MLKKNVYIMFPAGYGGSYVSWALSISDLDLQKTVPVDPLNRSASSTYGGPGTAHHHIRIPTHQGLIRHLIWNLYNRPQDPKIYVINPIGYNDGRGIATIAKYDPEGIFINIHDADDSLVKSYTEINCVTKWPTFVMVRLFDEEQSRPSWKLHNSFDPYNCAGDREFRNFVVVNQGFFTYNRPITADDCRRISQKQQQWYQIRNQYQPHEINTETYVDKINLKGRVFNIDCRDVASPELINIVKQILDESDASDRYDTGIFQEYHPQYISAQRNLQWFESHSHWKRTGNIDDYIKSHSIIQAQILKEILYRGGYYTFNEVLRDFWISLYIRVKGVDWPEVPLDPREFWNLPRWIQDELVDVHGYSLPMEEKPKFDADSIDWRNMDITDINDVYQESLKK